MLILQLTSTQAFSPGDNIVSNVARTNGPITQDSAVQIPGQLSHSSLLQRSAQDVVENRPESPWLARELERFDQNDLYDVLRSPLQERSLQDDVIRQAKTELQHQNSAINKHLSKKAALEEKSKSWELDSGVSSDSDEGAVDPFQTKPAIEKRILELEEASRRQDLAIKKHNTKKAALERGIKRHLDYKPGQPSKKPVSEAAEANVEPSASLTEAAPVAGFGGGGGFLAGNCGRLGYHSGYSHMLSRLHPRRGCYCSFKSSMDAMLAEFQHVGIEGWPGRSRHAFGCSCEKWI